MDAVRLPDLRDQLDLALFSTLMFSFVLVMRFLRAIFRFSILCFVQRLHGEQIVMHQ